MLHQTKSGFSYRPSKGYSVLCGKCGKKGGVLGPGDGTCLWCVGEDRPLDGLLALINIRRKMTFERVRENCVLQH